jgi:DNA ligase-1
MHLSSLVELVGRLRVTPRKTEKVQLLAEFLRQCRGEDIELAAYYLSGSLPQGAIGIGGRVLAEAITGEAPAGQTLALADLDEAFGVIAGARGPGSAERKRTALQRLLARATPREREFVVQLISGELRQGAVEGLLREAIARAAALPAADVRRAMMYSGSIGQVARIALEEGGAGLARFSLRLFTPVAPMLANTAEDVEEALGRLGEAAFEYKIDGARIQIHKGGDDVRIFTRALQDVTPRLPEIVEWTRSLPETELVLEGEAIALRPEGRPYPFQVTMRRFGRTKNVDELRQQLPLSPFVFDSLYRSGEGSLVSMPYQERFRLLEKTIPEAMLMPNLATSDADEAGRFLERALDAGHEGVMAKSLTAGYEAGQRGFHWLKLKPAKTLDLVVLAVEWGHGRRTGLLSNLHLGARDPQSGQFVMLGKTFKGLTDELLAWQTEKLLALETGRDEYTVYVRPELVVEIAFSGIQESPRYPGGVALRFARVKRYRPEKTAAEADTIQTVLELFRREHGSEV